MEDVSVKIQKPLAAYIAKQEWFKELYRDLDAFILEAARGKMDELDRRFSKDPRTTMPVTIDIPAPIFNYLHAHVHVHGGTVEDHLVAFVCDGLQAVFTSMDHSEQQAILKKFNLTMLGLE